MLVIHAIYEFTSLSISSTWTSNELSVGVRTTHTRIYNIHTRKCTTGRQHGFRCNQGKIPIKCKACVCTLLFLYSFSYSVLFNSLKVKKCSPEAAVHRWAPAGELKGRSSPKSPRVPLHWPRPSCWGSQGTAIWISSDTPVCLHHLICISHSQAQRNYSSVWQL